jgi:alpha-1,3-rhamnosyl/mannosyltransferase
MDSIVFDATTLMMDHIKGITAYCIHLCKALEEQGLTIRYVHKGSRRRNAAFIEQWTGKRSRGYWPYLSDPFLRGPSVFHGPDFKMIASPLWRRVVTVHDMAILHPDLLDERFCQIGGKALRRTMKKLPDAIITCTEFVAHEVATHFPEVADRIHPIFLGSDHLKPSGRVVSRENDYFLYVGTIEKRKNVGNILLAFEEFHRRNPETQLWIVGKTGYGCEDLLPRLEALERQGAVRQRGYVESEELSAIYEGAKGLLYPSLYEGFGIPVMEAMALGCPVITSREGAVSEVAGDCATKVDPGSPREICQAMEALHLDHPRELVERARQRARGYSWARCAEKTIEVYEAVSRG